MNFRRAKSTEFPTKRRNQSSRIAQVGVVMKQISSFLFLLSLITGGQSFLVKNVKLNCIRNGETNQCHQKHEYYTSTWPSTPKRTSHELDPLLSFHISLSSSKQSDFSSDSSAENDVSATDDTPSNSTTASNGNASKMDQRKRYGNELEEAFAQQTRERNPLLGVKSVGVDYGLVRTGVAVTIGYNPEALDVIVTDHPLLREDEAEGMLEEDIEKEEERRLEIQRARVTERVIELASRENADRIVVGLPLHKNGTEAPQSMLARKFAHDHLAIAALRNLGPGVSVYMCDERYTSKEAAARMRTSSQSSRSNNEDLYGLLDAESAKIILEQYYNDHVDRYNTRNVDSETKNVNPGYNGELVTISDEKLVEELTQEYNEEQRLERERLETERNDREDRAKWRKLEMEKYRKQQEENAANGITSTKKKKKKKKKKR